jgi:hypothetical protein
MWVAQPNLNNLNHAKEFADAKAAVKYLEEVTGFEMGKEKDPKTGVITYDWELIGKLYQK